MRSRRPHVCSCRCDRSSETEWWTLSPDARSTGCGAGQSRGFGRWSGGIKCRQDGAGLGARVKIFDIDLDRLRYLDDTMPANVNTCFSTPFSIREAFSKRISSSAQCLSPETVRRYWCQKNVAEMPEGPSLSTSLSTRVAVLKPVATTHAEPTYVADGVVRHCVANMPGAVSRTSTLP